MPPLPTPPPRRAETDAARLLQFNRDLLAQALALVALHGGFGRPPLAGPVGAHLRHVIEHDEALLNRAPGATEVDYDRRPRDPLLECCTVTARARLQALLQRLAAAHVPRLDTPLLVRGQGGLAGEFGFATASTLGRELVFVASHTVHHFALLQPHLATLGLPLPADFGKAPATVAHQRRAAGACLASGAAASPVHAK